MTKVYFLPVLCVLLLISPSGTQARGPPTILNVHKREEDSGGSHMNKMPGPEVRCAMSAQNLLADPKEGLQLPQAWEAGSWGYLVGGAGGHRCSGKQPSG